MRNLAIIPARGGSKGIPGKNIKLLNGQPMISYTINAALKSSAISTVMVSTDSKDIARVAKDCGADVPFMRPKELALDSSKTIECICHAVDSYKQIGVEFDVITILQPTSPLRTAEDIEGCFETFINSGMRGTVSISEVLEHPILMRTIDEDHNLKSLLNVCSTVRRQDMPKYYRVNGAIAMFNSDDVVSDLSINDAPIGYIMDIPHSIDIDSYDDFIQAEIMLKKEKF